MNPVVLVCTEDLAMITIDPAPEAWSVVSAVQTPEASTEFTHR